MRTKRWIPLVAVLAMTALTVGCGGDDGGEKEEPDVEEFQVNGAALQDFGWVSASMAPNGRFAVAWGDQARRAVLARWFDANAMALGGESQVGGDSWVGDSPRISMASTGESLVVWMHMASSGFADQIFGRRYSASGSPVGTEFPISSTFGVSNSVDVSVAPGGQSTVVWDQPAPSAGVWGQRLSADGAKLGLPFRVNTTTQFGGHASVAMLSGGSFVVGWINPATASGVSPRTIAVQRFASDGSKTGGELHIATSGGPAVTGLPGGGFVITWVHDDRSVQGQRYAADGTKAGSQFKINTSSGSFNSNTAVSASPDGKFIVAWILQSQASSKVLIQRFAVDGSKVGSETQVNSTSGTEQQSVSITTGSDGRFIVAWMNYTDSSQSVRARLFLN